MPGALEFRLGKTSEHALGGIGAENRLLKPVALLDLSMLNFGIMRDKSGGPSCNRPREVPAVCSHDAVIRVYDAAGQRHRNARARGRFRER